MKVLLNKEADFPQSWEGAVVGFDIETSSKDWTQAKICLVSVYNPDVNEAHVVPIIYSEGIHKNRASGVVIEKLKKFLRTVRVVGHSLSYDLTIVKKEWGIDIDVEFDTYLLACLLQLRDTSLKGICSRIDNTEYKKFRDEQDLSEETFEYDINDAEMVAYSGLDAYLPFKVIDYYKESIKRRKAILRLELSYLKSAIVQQSTGLCLEMGAYRSAVDTFQAKFDSLQEKLDNLAGYHCRPSSNVEVGRFLFDVMQMAPVAVSQKTGKPSVNSDVLNQLESDYAGDVERTEAISLLKEVKHAQSVLSSLKKVPTVVRDGKLWFRIKQVSEDNT